MGLSNAIKNIKKAGTLIVTPKIDAFLAENPDGVIWDDAGYELFKGITQRAMGNEDRSGRFGSSSRGTCLRRQIFTYIGMPEGRIIDPELQNLFNDGKWRHIRWQMMGVQSGALTHAEWPVALPKYRMTSSIDGLHAVDKYGFELKGDSNWSRTMTGVPEAHDLQIHSMMLAMGWDRFVYLVEDKRSQNWREIIVNRNPATITKVRDELQELNEYVEQRELPDPLPACAQKQGPYKTCPFAPHCIDRWRNGNKWPDERDWNS